MKNLLLIGTLVLTMNAFAKSDKGNGGDICENKMRNITNDIESWLLKDEYRGIKLPVNLTEELYKQEMLEAVSKSILSCTTDRILVGSAEKTCRNFVDNNGAPQIQCNFDRFNSTEEKEKYKLMHHELAGVSGFETNVNEASNYQISNQVGEFLSQASVLVLGIKKITPIKDKIGACKVLPPNTSDKNRMYCGGTSFSVTYKGYSVEDKCYSSIDVAIKRMEELAR
jgi:hypothetical protein